MTKPTFHADDFEQALLASAKGEGMRADRKAALALALGVGATTVIAAAGTAKAATAGASVAASKAKLSVMVAVMKWIAAGAVGGAAIVGATTTLRRSREVSSVELVAQQAHEHGRPTEAPPRPRAMPSASSANPAALPPPLAVELPAVIEAPAAPPAIAPRAVAAPAPRAKAPSAIDAPAAVEAPPAPRREAAPLLADEQRTIERARDALAAGDVPGAHRVLDEHDRRFSDGAFMEESRVLRIDALARSGQRSRAQSEARAFLARAPSSPYAARLRELAAVSVEP